MAVACSVLDVLEDENLQENARVVGAYLKKKLQGLQSAHPEMGDVRGEGLLVGVEFVKDATSKEPAPELSEAITEMFVSIIIIV